MFTCKEIATATGGTLVGSGKPVVSGVCTDSRSIKGGELFVALCGGRFDGHDYLADVVARGIAVAVVEQEWLAGHEKPAGLTCIAVTDTLRALGDLAAFHRKRFTLPVIGVTGSNGKTTTKEMISSILEQTGPGLKTEGNLNNLIGLPQMIFRLGKEDRWAVLEMGMSEPGEIARLAEIAAPAVGVITNAFPAHLESMGSVEAVALAKGELFMRLTEGGWAVYNADDRLVAGLPVPEGVRRFSFGLHGAEVTATHIGQGGRSGESFTLCLPDGTYPIQLKSWGRHNIYNALAAAAAACAIDVPSEAIVQGLARFNPVDKRFRLEELDGVTLIDDSYNANPGSLAAALVTLSEVRGDARAIAVLGDMLELGSIAMEAHREVGRLAATCVSRLYLMGRFAETTKAGAVEGGMAEDDIVVAESHEQILMDLRGTLQQGDMVLVKGSRGMRMEVVSEGIRTWWAAPARKGAF